MTYPAPITPHDPDHATDCDRVVKAHLLLSEPYSSDIDAVGAAFLASIGLKGAALKGAQKSRGATKLVLHTDDTSLLVAKSKSPLGATHFSKSIPPLLSPAERSAFIAIISHHEAFITLTLRTDASHSGNNSALLHQAVKAASCLTQPLGLLWGPTKRLHQGDAMRTILKSNAPLELFISPVFKQNGPRKTQIINFVGAQEILGFGLGLHMIQLSRQKAVDAGLAFADMCANDQTFHTRRSFQHNGQTFRLTHNDQYISLIPVARFSKDIASIIKSDAKTAA